MAVDIIPRSAWGAQAPRSVSKVSWAGKRTLWVHHSETQAPANDPGSERAVVRSIQNYHRNTQGWADIGYAYLVAPSGRIYEGRGFEVWGSHCPGHNGEPSVCLIGSYQNTPPTRAQVAAVWALADWLGCTSLAGHREGYTTSCPGDATMRTLVNAARPAPTPKPAKPEPDWATRRLAIQTEKERAAGLPGRKWAGREAAGALRWIAKNGLNRKSEVALAHGGNVWRTADHGNAHIASVARALCNRFSI